MCASSTLGQAVCQIILLVRGGLQSLCSLRESMADKTQLDKSMQCFALASCANPWIWWLPSQLPPKTLLPVVFEQKYKVNNPKTFGHQSSM